MRITISAFAELEELFKKQQWEIVKDAAMFSSLFNRYCRRLELFEEDKQKLLIELGHRFLDLGINDYETYFIETIKKVPEINLYKTIIVAPLKRPSLTETKSADHIWYHLKNFIDFSYESFGSKLFFCSRWETIANSLNPETILFLVDDFIGTGETVIKTIEELYEMNIVAAGTNLKVITFLAQIEGMERVNEQFPNVAICNKGLNKGISDFYAGDELRKNINLMLEMEKKLKVSLGFQFGYGHSESLVAISNRSVNNTFPVFWLEKKNLAPFKR